MSKSQPTYKELLIENERLRQLVSQKNDSNISFTNSTKTTPDKDALKELKLEAALENMIKGFFITDTDGNFTNFNTAFSKFHGFKNKEECAKTLDQFFKLFEGFLPNGKALTLAEWPVSRALRGETVNNAEYLLKRIDTGEIWPCTYSFAPIVDSQGNITGSVVSCENITEQKNKELELLAAKNIAEENENNLKRGEQIASMGYWKLDVETLKVSASDELLKIFKIDSEELISDSFAAIVHPEDRAFNQEHINNAIAHGIAWNFEIRLLFKDGSIKWVSSIGEPQMNESKKVATIIGIVQDITERKQIEEKLIISELKYRNQANFLNTVVENSSFAMWVSDAHGKLIISNQALKDILNVTDEMIIGKYNVLQDKSIYNQGYMDNVEAVFNDLKITRFSMFWTGSKVENADFSSANERWIDVSMYPITDETGKLTNVVCQYLDITESKLAEQTLKESKNHYHTLFNYSPISLWEEDITDLVSYLQKIKEKGIKDLFNHFEKNPDELMKSTEMIKILDVNQHALNLNQAKSKKQLIENLSETFTEKSFTVYKNLLLALFEGKKTFKSESEFKTLKGEIKNIYITLNINKKEQGKIKALLAISDITELKLAEQAMVESEAKFSSAFNESPIPLSILDIETGERISVNEKFITSFGHSRSQLLKGNFNQTYLSVDKRELMKVVDQIKREGFLLDYPFQMVTNKGDVRDLLISAARINNQHKNQFIVSNIDITDRKESEELILKNKNRLDYALKSIKTGAWEIDLKTLESWRTLKHDQIFGHEKGLDKWTYNMFLEHIVFEDREMVDQKFQHAITTNTDWNFECRITRNNDGKVRWILANGNLELNDLKKPIKMFGVVRDITKQKNIDQKLVSAKEKAEESDRLKSAFLANMSHEIRTPMNGILGFINLLNLPNLNKEKIDAYSKIINKSGHRLLNTINNIIDISKIESGEIDTTISKIYLNNELEELYSFHAPEANLNGLSLIIDPLLLTTEIAVLTDGNKLHGILTNLIKNAIKYTETGSITFGYSIKNNFIEFFVKDTGIGIPKNRIHAIFNRFEQADIEDTKAFEGSGLGLAISKAYTKMLGGEIFVTSEEGKGSKFTFTIPYNIEEKESIIKTSETIENNISKFGELNLLIVDDDDTSSQLLEIILEGIFQKIIFAKNGIEAIQLCENNPKIDMVLMDIKMPEMDGYDTTREIRKFNKDLIIIAQTAYVMPGDKEKTLKVGCNDYISKPINKKLLLEIIDKHMSDKCI